MAEQHVIEGTWEEVAARAASLAGSGRRVKLIVPPDESEGAIPPENMAALALLDEWLEEDQAVSPKERETADREWEEFRADLEAHPVSFRIPQPE